MPEDIHTYIEPELEARITALVLGEVSEFDVEELEQIIAAKPELQIFRRRMQAMHELIGKTVKPEKDAAWQLSEDRRAKLRRQFLQQPASAKNPSKVVSMVQWKSMIRIAACVAVCVVIFSLMATVKFPQADHYTPEIVSYQVGAPEDNVEQFSHSSREKYDFDADKKGNEKSLRLEAGKYKSKLAKKERMLTESNVSVSEGRRMKRAVERKPSAPSSSMAKVLAANSSSPTAIPVPTAEDMGLMTGVAFGDVSDFGDVWGEASGGTSGGSRFGILPEVNSPSSVAMKDMEAPNPSVTFANSDDAEDRFGRSNISKASSDSRISGTDSTVQFQDSDSDAIREKSVKSKRSSMVSMDGASISGRGAATTIERADILSALSGEFVGNSTYNYEVGTETAEVKKSEHRRSVSKNDTSQLLDKVEEIRQTEKPQDVSSPSITSGKKLSLEPLQKGAKDRLFSKNKPMSEGEANVDKVRKTLYMAEGYYNLGKYDAAEAEMKKVLQVDPYNKAARRWLEKVSATKSDYYRAAYDETRATLLAEVDKAWEMSIPSEDITKDQPKVELPAKATSKKLPAQKRPKPLPEETSTTAQPFSTFSLNVSDVSFKLAKAALLEKGQWPDSAKVRTEEFINAFDYGDPSPRRGEPVACAIEQATHPFLQQRNLLRIGMKTAALGRSTPLRLTVLLDNSGSMEREDREASVLAAMRVLAAQLGPQDKITLVSFARQPRLLADRISGDQADQLVDIVANTPSEGGTNLEEAIRLARSLAKRQHTEGAQDRIVLITDGVANLGNTVPEELSREIEILRQEGIAFDACGVGAEGLNDDILEALTRKGDGRYYFLNRAEDADSGFAKQLAGALSPAAKNVKVQVVFNPKRVSKYRLLGFEKHRLNKEDFRNDSVDAAEMAAEEAGNAVYQINTIPDGEGELGEVFVRFQDTNTGRMVERSWPLAYESQAQRFSEATPSMQLAGTASMLGEKLHGTDAGSVRFSTISSTLGKLRAHYAANRNVQDLIRMCEKVK